MLNNREQDPYYTAVFYGGQVETWCSSKAKSDQSPLTKIQTYHGLMTVMENKSVRCWYKISNTLSNLSYSRFLSLLGCKLLVELMPENQLTAVILSSRRCLHP